MTNHSPRRARRRRDEIMARPAPSPRPRVALLPLVVRKAPTDLSVDPRADDPSPFGRRRETKGDVMTDAELRERVKSSLEHSTHDAYVHEAAHRWLEMTRADDGEAIDEAFLLSIEFSKDDTNGDVAYWTYCDPPENLWVGQVEKTKDWHVWLASPDEIVVTFQREYRTRGHLRHLCKSLGIELKETP